MVTSMSALLNKSIVPIFGVSQKMVERPRKESQADFEYSAEYVIKFGVPQKMKTKVKSRAESPSAM
jgi:hypothetical protein